MSSSFNCKIKINQVFVAGGNKSFITSSLINPDFIMFQTDLNNRNSNHVIDSTKTGFSVTGVKTKLFSHQKV